jgi:hypothetical protein
MFDVDNSDHEPVVLECTNEPEITYPKPAETLETSKEGLRKALG